MVSGCKFPGAGVCVLLHSIIRALLCVGQAVTGLVRAGGGVVGSVLQLAVGLVCAVACAASAAAKGVVLVIACPFLLYSIYIHSCFIASCGRCVCGGFSCCMRGVAAACGRSCMCGGVPAYGFLSGSKQAGDLAEANTVCGAWYPLCFRPLQLGTRPFDAACCLGLDGL
jgi:hypothetical protein